MLQVLMIAPHLKQQHRIKLSSWSQEVCEEVRPKS